MSSSLAILARRRTYIRSALAGLGTFAAVYMIDRVLAHFSLAAEATMLDDVLLGIMVGLLVMFIEVRHQKGLQAQQDKLWIATAMNHHIRNALQTIVYVNFQNPDANSAEKIKEAASRIEWALREVLPGNHRAKLTPPDRGHTGNQ